jgi:hypothetical protein
MGGLLKNKKAALDRGSLRKYSGKRKFIYGIACTLGNDTDQVMGMLWETRPCESRTSNEARQIPWTLHPKYLSPVVAAVNSKVPSGSTVGVKIL